MKKTLLFGAILCLAVQIHAQTVTDFDGNVYNTVVIGTQEWMQENLKSLHYADGTAITGVTAYDNNEANVATYGRLYTWNAAMNNSIIEMSQGVCPTGWHLANDQEWDTLITFLGGANVAGGKLKEAGFTHWTSPNTGADNSSGFTALPGGFYFNSSFFVNINTYAKFWTSSQVNGAPSQAYNCALKNNEASINSGSSSPVGNEKTLGASIRCIKGVGMVGIKSNEVIPELNFYLNPSHDFFQIKNVNNCMYRLQVFNMLGVCVLQKECCNSENIIDISYLSKGVYVINISYNNKVLQAKFIKQ